MSTPPLFFVTVGPRRAARLKRSARGRALRRGQLRCQAPGHRLRPRAAALRIAVPAHPRAPGPTVLRMFVGMWSSRSSARSRTDLGTRSATSRDRRSATARADAHTPAGSACASPARCHGMQDTAYHRRHHAHGLGAESTGARVGGNAPAASAGRPMMQPGRRDARSRRGFQRQGSCRTALPVAQVVERFQAGRARSSLPGTYRTLAHLRPERFQFSENAPGRRVAHAGLFSRHRRDKSHAPTVISDREAGAGAARPAAAARTAAADSGSSQARRRGRPPSG